MPIEDIGFLKQNSEKKSNIVLIDSVQRDIVAYPHPNEYVVTFQEPFNNVIGLEVLDASVPRTMYVVDWNNNKLVLYIGTDCITYGPDGLLMLDRSRGTRVQIDITTGDYLLEEIISTVNTSLTGYGMELLSQSTDKPSRKSSVYFKNDTTPFVIDMQESTCREVFGFGEISFQKGSLRKYTKILDEFKNPRLFGSVIDVSSNVSNELVRFGRYTFSNDSEVYYYSISLGMNSNDKVYSKFAISSTSDNDYYLINHLMLPMKNLVITVESDYILRIKIIKSTSGYTFNDPVIKSYTDSDVIFSGVIQTKTFDELVLGGYNVSQLFEMSNLPTNTSYVCGFVDMTSSNLYLQGNISYWIEISNDYDSSQQAILFGDSKEYSLDSLSKVSQFVIAHEVSNQKYKIFDVIQGSSEALEPNFDNTSLHVIGDIDQLSFVPTSCLLMGINYDRKTNVVYAPGVVSLIGPRYMLLRIPEIEAHTQSSYSYTTTSQGMAMFKLGLYGYSDTRFDFSSINYLPFHPIARMTKLTMRFTLPEGILYDFKGVEHHLLLSIKTLVPTVDVGDISPQLNPNYTPNILDYITRKRIEDLAVPPTFIARKAQDLSKESKNNDSEDSEDSEDDEDDEDVDDESTSDDEDNESSSEEDEDDDESSEEV